jgi:hypothetical protein
MCRAGLRVRSCVGVGVGVGVCRRLRIVGTCLHIQPVHQPLLPLLPALRSASSNSARTRLVVAICSSAIISPTTASRTVTLSLLLTCPLALVALVALVFDRPIAKPEPELDPNPAALAPVAGALNSPLVPVALKTPAEEDSAPEVMLRILLEGIRLA